MKIRLKKTRINSFDFLDFIYFRAILVTPTLVIMKAICYSIFVTAIIIITLTSCEKSKAEIDYSGFYQGTRIESRYRRDASGNLSFTTNSDTGFIMPVEKGRNGYYLLNGGYVTYFEDGIAEGHDDITNPEYYSRRYFELKSDSLIGRREVWWADNGEIGWWLIGSDPDSNNYRFEEFFLRAL